MGNSASPGLGSGATHGLRDVRTADPETEVERPPANPEPNRKSESNRKSHEQLPVPSKPYSIFVAHRPIPTYNVTSGENVFCEYFPTIDRECSQK